MSQKEVLCGQSLRIEADSAEYLRGIDSEINREIGNGTCEARSEESFGEHRHHTNVARRSLSTPRQHDSIGPCVELSATSAL